MACCGNKGACNKQTPTLPTEEFLGSAGISADLAAKLLQIAAAGLSANTILRRFGFADTALETLGKKIADLAIENEYLRKVTDLFSPTVFDTTGGNITIAFGPKSEYVLNIPLTSNSDRSKIIKQLRTAADKLDLANAPEESPQKVLPFLAK